MSQGGTVSSPPPSAIRIDAKHASLGDILQQLNARYGVNSVVDGRPIPAMTDVQFQGTLHDCLDRLATVFDYTWTRSKAGVILFSKSFRNPEDRPQLIPQELRESAKDMLRALPNVEEDTTHQLWGAVLVQLSRTFTPEQVALLRGGNRLPSPTLSPDQQQLVHRAILIRAYGVPRAYWERIFFQLDNLPTSRIVLRPPGGKPGPPDKSAGSWDVLYISRGKGGQTFEARLGAIRME